MEAFIYCADLYCEDCGRKIRDELIAAGKAPQNPADETSYDSDDFPKGPYPDGGGEADYFAHCGNPECSEFLANPLTSDGMKNVAESFREYVRDDGGNADVLDKWAEELGGYNLMDEQKFALVAYIKVRQLEKLLPPAATPANS